MAAVQPEPWLRALITNNNNNNNNSKFYDEMPFLSLSAEDGRNRFLRNLISFNKTVGVKPLGQQTK
jgi:hypothetical protein